ncbi:MAG: hypothetical protein NTV86_18165 [Planctomycetota bacterium]|nr:hypothetical protein [Planctomycetota bacterium]
MAKRTVPVGATSSPALAYIGLIRKRITAIRKDTPALIEMGQRMAESLLEGGSCYAPVVAPFWQEEWTCRAGGLMGIKPPTYVAQSRKDVAYFALPGRADWDPRQDAALQTLVKSKAQLFAIGRPEELKGAVPVCRFAGFTGGAPKDIGLYRLGAWQPLAPVRSFDQVVRGWIVTGEMIAACIRGGRMPILWMSIWLDGAMARNCLFHKHDNLHEPWSVPFFHEDRYIPPLAPGYAAREFLRELEKIIGSLQTQAGALAQAGQWMADAHRAGRRPWTISVDHSYPTILELPAGSEYPLEWSRPNSNLRTAVPDRFGRGDLAIHLGYGPVDVEDLGRILKRGIRFVHTTPYGRPATLKDHPNLLWLDLPWRPTDATVDIPAYSVRMMPMSSTAHTVGYFALLCEMAERMDWR